MVETRIIVKPGYEELHADIVAKLENIELEAKAKVEMMIADDKRILNNILGEITELVDVEIEEPVEENAEITPENPPVNF